MLMKATNREVAGLDCRCLACNYQGGAALPQVWRILHPGERADLNRFLNTRRLRGSVFARLLLRAGMAGRLPSGSGRSRVRPYSAGAVVEASKAEMAWPVIRYRRPPDDRCPVLEMHGSCDAAYASIAHDDEFCLVVWDFARPVGCKVQRIPQIDDSTTETLDAALAALVGESYYKMTSARGAAQPRGPVPAAVRVRIEAGNDLLSVRGHLQCVAYCGPDDEPCDLSVTKHGERLFVVLSGRE